MTNTKTPYLVPLCAGLQSEPSAVGSQVAAILNALEGLNDYTAKGSLVDTCHEFRTDILLALRADNWRVSIRKASDNWKVLPPLPVKTTKRKGKA